jgi:hypothetical protein
MGIFTSAPVFKPSSSKRKRRWNVYAQRAKQQKDMRMLVAENVRLRAENARLLDAVQRLQSENDSLWDTLKPGK